MKNFFKKILPIVDFLLMPLTYLACLLLRFIRKTGVHKMSRSKKIFAKVGVFPILDHYEEPLFNYGNLKKSLRQDRSLPAIDFNVKQQLELLRKFHFNEEFRAFALKKTDKPEFYYHNDFFEAADAEYLYNIIRLYKPRKIIEIGGGYSTLMAQNAIRQNQKDDLNYKCEHICIEPYERPWLSEAGVNLIRKKVEDVDKAIFDEMSAGDILFIDSSHVIKPQGDVLFEYLEILPSLKKDVLVHIHDILTPKDYFGEWLVEKVKFINEQYLVEAFLSFNEKYKIIGALNYLYHKHFDELSSVCPSLKREPKNEPRSFWLIRN